MTDYNPYILGYVEQGGRSGDVWLPLQEAIETFGDLPSRYGFLPEFKVRRQRRTLNLALGSAINHILRCVPDLKRQVFEVYEAWHPDWATEIAKFADSVVFPSPGLGLVTWMTLCRLPRALK